ncbi:kunitz trypsin inhibitor 5-like [Nicotiana tomentosiformis]|uniref:kunitz trypsin inhibitor 5-like n=1 Tax=Nicotiana tomentosiformis TaxID=4098 RepID=UPI00051C9109|nr:kunitz trypsin inhibitor 5-like [Nicotiana tomentosiformis]
MKIEVNVRRLFIVPLILVALSTSFFFLVKAQDVLDVSGKDVRKGGYYRIIPAGRGNGGGITVASIRNRTNPLVVSQHADESILSVSTQFSPANSNENTIKISSDLNIKFTSEITLSNSSNVWRINTELIPQRYLVTVGGVEGNPGRETLSNWFRIDKYEDAYKLVYCPGVCETCSRTFCGDIGILVEGNERVLFVGSDKPLKVTFDCIKYWDETINNYTPCSSAIISNKLPALSFVKVVIWIVICFLIKLM